MHLLLIGNGGREHALAWKLAQSPRVTRVSVAPGNPGTAAEPKVANLDIAADDTEALLAFARDHDVAFTVVGPEAPLVAGIADAFADAGLELFGPSAAAARLEGSKAFAKDFMARHGIPSAAHATFDDEREALAWLDAHGAPIVVKADGLAAGKGVVVAEDLESARAAVTDMLGGGRFGAAGRRVVLEERLEGEEASFIALVAGRDALPLASSQDHKRRDEGDRGPNTGGMGAYSPAPVVTEAVHAHVVADILRPTVDALADEGTPFTGFLYVGLMIDASGAARVIEYNVRLGDPETQPLMLRLESDLAELVGAALEGDLGGREARWRAGSAIGVVLAAADYPAGGSRGEPIEGVEAAEAGGCKVFHAGTRRRDGRLETDGGRVLAVCAADETLEAAKRRADAGAETVRWPGRHRRGDIGHRALARR